MIQIRFGHIGGKHSAPITCATRTHAALLASNIAFVHGGFGQEAANHSQWLLNARTTRISWETADKSYFIEVVKQ